MSKLVVMRREKQVAKREQKPSSITETNIRQEAPAAKPAQPGTARRGTAAHEHYPILYPPLFLAQFPRNAVDKVLVGDLFVLAA